MNTEALPQDGDPGFGMQGMWPLMSRVLNDVCERFDSITYLEIGVGHGATLAVMASRLQSVGKPWRAIGVDLPDGYSLNTRAVSTNMVRMNVPFVRGDNGATLEWNRATLYLADSMEFVPNWKEPTQVALIDGCHGKPCAMKDFLNIEAMIPVGGIVMFHDFGADQIGQSQTHCPTLDVIGACRELGLMDNTRPGWHFNETLVGFKSAGSGDMGVFERVNHENPL